VGLRRFVFPLSTVEKWMERLFGKTRRPASNVVLTLRYTEIDFEVSCLQKICVLL